MRNNVKYKVNDVTKKITTKRCYISSWCDKWNRTLAAFFALFSFFLILFLFLCNVNNQTSSNDPTLKALVENSIRRVNDSRKECILKNNNVDGITCFNYNENEIEKMKEEINKLGKTTDSFALILDHITFPNNVMTNNYFEGIVFEIPSLTIKNTNVKIEEEALAAFPLKLNQLNMEEIIESTNLTKLFFNGTNIKILSILNSNIPSADPFTLYPLRNCLESLSLEQSVSDQSIIYNLIGGNHFELNKLTEINLRFNKVDYLLDDSFSKAKSLTAITLDHSSILYLNPFTFRYINPQKITISYNKLRTLPEVIFQNLTNEHSLYLNGNQWACTCDFQWFQDVYLQRQSIINKESELYCITKKGTFPLETYDFCKNNTNPTPKPTDYVPTTTKMTTKSETTEIQTTTSKITTKSEPNFPVTCYSANLKFGNRISVLKNKNQQLFLPPLELTLTFYQIDEEPEFIVTLNKSLTENWIVVIINKSGFVRCLNQIYNTIYLFNLEYGESYVFCFLDNLAESFTISSPLVCQSFSVPDDNSKQPWITNKYKNTAILIFVLSLIIISFLSCIGMYFYNKYNPKLLNGNKNVIIVKKDNSTKFDETSDSRYYEEPNYYSQESSLMSISSGYLTPKRKTRKNILLPYVNDLSYECLGRREASPYFIRSYNENFEYVSEMQNGNDYDQNIYEAFEDYSLNNNNNSANQF